MKRNKLSPATSLVVSLSLVVGILVSDLAGARFLTAAHAQTGGGCAGQSSVNISRGVLSGGVVLQNVTVGGQLVALAYVPGNVQIARGAIRGVNGVIVSDGGPGSVNGVIVSDGGPDYDGVIVSDGSPDALDGVIVSDGIRANGVIVSDGGPCSTNGVIVSDGGPSSVANRDGVIVSDGSPNGGTNLDGVIVSDGIRANGVIVSDGGNVVATGGVLSGENLSVENGVVTGLNLSLTGATISGSMNFNGTVKSVRVAPSN